MTDSKETLLKFPCSYDIKIVGLATEAFETEVLGIILQHAPDLREDAIRTRHSKHSKYLSITVTIQAQSQSQLDTIYSGLSNCELVIASF